MLKKRFDWIMLTVLLGYFIILVDTSLVFTCSNEIGRSFAMTTTTATWISNAYALTFGSLLLLGGRLGDRYGRRPVFIAGLLLFGLSSLGVGLAPSAGWLIGARAIQGIGAAIIAPATLAILLDNYHGAQQAHAIAVYGAMSGIGVSLGLIIGAGITTLLSWRYGFFINGPITLILIFLTIRVIPRSQAAHFTLDWPGALLSFSGTVALINGINGGGPRSLSLGFGILLLAGFIYHEAHTAVPLVPLTLFANATRRQAYLIRLSYSAAITGFWFFTPRILQTMDHLSPILVGGSFLPMTLVNFWSARRVDQLARRWGNQRLLFGGLIIALLGFAGLLSVHAGGNYWLTVALPMLLIGYGQGLVLSPVTTLAIDGLAPTAAGVGSGLINVMLQLGGVLGLAILSTLVTHQSAFTAYHWEISGILVFVGLSLLSAWRLLGHTIQERATY